MFYDLTYQILANILDNTQIVPMFTKYTQIVPMFTKSILKLNRKVSIPGNLCTSSSP